MKGFTLVELVAVLLILSIMLAVVLPNITVIQNYRVKTSARHILQLLKRAQLHSIAEGETYTVFFYGKNFGDKEYRNSYSLKHRPGDPSIENFKLIKGVVFERISLGQSTYVSYYSDRSVNTGGQIILKNKNTGYTVEIIIHAITGRARINER